MMTPQQVEDCLANPRGASYVRVDSGPRRDAIARVVGKSESAWRSLYVEWDGRLNKVTLDWTNLTLLYGYNGPTVWVYQTKQQDTLVGPVDSIGQEFRLDDLVFYRQGKTNQFGVVVEIKPTGGVYVRRTPISVHSSGKTHIERIIQRNDALIIRDNLKNALLTRKLKLASH